MSKKKISRISSIYAFIPAVCLIFCSFTSYAANNTTASVMRLEKTVGDVSLTTSNGTASQIIEKMRMNSGDDVKSSSKSYAYISLDASKVVKLDALSEAVVTKNKNKFDLELQSGNLLFDVEKPLESYEGFDIKTTNMTMGIRGTCAQVEKKSDNITSISVLDGTIVCTATNPITGYSQTATIYAGQHADYCTGDEYVNGCQIIIRGLMMEDLRGFTLHYISENSELAQKIFDETGMDLRFLTEQQVYDRLNRDESGEVATVNTGRVSPSAGAYSQSP